MDEHPWMQHNKTGHRAQLPDLPYWRAQGWQPCAGPYPEPDTLRDPEPPAAEAEHEKQPKKPAAKPASSTEEK